MNKNIYVLILFYQKNILHILFGFLLTLINRYKLFILKQFIQKDLNEYNIFCVYI